MSKCYFSSGIDDSLTCCKDGIFDDNGFPINRCPNYPCKRYKETRESVIKGLERKGKGEKKRTYYIQATLTMNVADVLTENAAISFITDSIKHCGYDDTDAKITDITILKEVKKKEKKAIKQITRKKAKELIDKYCAADKDDPLSMVMASSLYSCLIKNGCFDFHNGTFLFIEKGNIFLQTTTK